MEEGREERGILAYIVREILEYAFYQSNHQDQEAQLIRVKQALAALDRLAAKPRRVTLEGLYQKVLMTIEELTKAIAFSRTQKEAARLYCDHLICDPAKRSVEIRTEVNNAIKLRWPKSRTALRRIKGLAWIFAEAK